jgi:ribonuclease BN (tRNA processing enzyme)
MSEKTDKKNPGQQQIKIELPEDQSDGNYANFVVITHSHAEFVLDFTRVVPGSPKAKVKSRVIMAPQNAKAFLHALEQNIQRYEEQNGEITLPGGGQQGGPFGFNPPDDILPN